MFKEIIDSKLFSEANKKNQFYRPASNRLYTSGCCNHCKYKSFSTIKVSWDDRLYGVFDGINYEERIVIFCTRGGFEIKEYYICNHYSPSKEYIKNNVKVKRKN